MIAFERVENIVECERGRSDVLFSRLSLTGL